MSHRLFPYSYSVSFQDFELEIAENDVYKFPDLLNEIRDEVFEIAARSRGWETEEGRALMRRNFKIGPLYEANGLVLIRRDGRLVGLAGSVNNWHLQDKSIVHLCSLGLLPEIQNRGFMQALLGLMWIVSWQDEVLRSNYVSQKVYVSAISQSPYVLAFLHKLFDVYPSPYRLAPDDDMLAVAKLVVERFDPALTLEQATFVLRNECKFFYKRAPKSADRRINQFCGQNLRYDEGDVFVMVGRVIPGKVEHYISRLNDRYPKLLEALRGFKLGLDRGINHSLDQFRYEEASDG